MKRKREVERRYDGALGWRDLPDGRVLVLYPTPFTYRLCLGPQDGRSYECAWSFQRDQLAEAMNALQNWDAVGKPPGRWVREVREL